MALQSRLELSVSGKNGAGRLPAAYLKVVRHIDAKGKLHVVVGFSECEVILQAVMSACKVAAARSRVQFESEILASTFIFLLS